MSEQCERCGAPATVHQCDLIGTEPEVGVCQACKVRVGSGGFQPGPGCPECVKGMVYYAKYTAGPPHHFCEQHRRAPKKIPWKAPPGWEPKI